MYMKQEKVEKLEVLESKINSLAGKVDSFNFEKIQLLLYFNVIISLILLAFVIGAVVKQLN